MENTDKVLLVITWPVDVMIRLRNRWIRLLYFPIMVVLLVVSIGLFGIPLALAGIWDTIDYDL